MPPVRFEPTIPSFEPAKTFGDLDRAATVIGVTGNSETKSQWKGKKKLNKIGMICSVKPALTEDLCVMHKEEFPITCYYKCDMYS
jgi:hypothetical protein